MPLGPGVRYRVTRRNGKKIRLAFRGNKVVEAKNLETGATHTEGDFEREGQKRALKKMSK